MLEIFYFDKFTQCGLIQGAESDKISVIIFFVFRKGKFIS